MSKRLWTLFLVAGCGGSPMNGGDGGAGGDMSGGGTEQCMTDNMAVALAGNYAVRGTLNVNVKVPQDCVNDPSSCILDTDAKSTIYLLAKVTQMGGSATVTASPCKIQIPPVMWKTKGQDPTILTASDMLIQSVKAVTSSATINGSNTCATFKSDPLAIVIGAQLANPASDALPKFAAASNPPVKLCGGMASTPCGMNAETGCICDQEMDMKAGATVGASGVPGLSSIDQVYLALRTVVQLDGQVFPASAGQATPGQRIRGNVAGLKLDQSPVGCHEMGMGDCDNATTDSAAKLNPLVQQSTNTSSTFVAMPVGANTTCSDVIANAATIFAGQ